MTETIIESRQSKPAQSFITLLVPFDVGESYVFRAESQSKPDDQWHDILVNGGGWAGKTEQFPSFQKPLGWIARLSLSDAATVRIKTETSAGATEFCLGPQLRQFLSKVSWIKPDAAQIELVFFSLGVGVLILEAEVEYSAIDMLQTYRKEREPNDHRDIIWWREDLKRSLKPLIKGSADYFTKCLRTAEQSEIDNKRRRLAKQKGIDRKTGIKDATYPYPVIFVDDSEYCDLLKKDREDRKIKLSDQGLMERPYEDALVYVGWAEAYVCRHNENSRRSISNDFIVALASWYGLIAMDRDAVFQMLEAMHARAIEDDRKFRADIRILRYAYMEAANAARPIRWTSKEKDLLLLDRIHEAWRSERLWLNIDERTRSLAAYCEEIAAKENENRTKRLTVIGLAITALTLGSVLADMVGLYERGWRFGLISIAGLAVAVLISCGYVARILGKHG